MVKGQEAYYTKDKEGSSILSPGSKAGYIPGLGILPRDGCN